MQNLNWNTTTNTDNLDITKSGTGDFYMTADYNTWYICSKCWWNVQVFELTSYPWATQYTCLKCWTIKTIEHKIPEPIIVDM